MSILRTITSTAVMIVTGKVVSEGFDKAKKRIQDYKEFVKQQQQEDDKESVTVGQVEASNVERTSH